MENLHDTIELMESSDYQDRFRAEYHQLRIRCEKLDAMIVKYEAGTLDFAPSCPIDLLKEQEKHMIEYLHAMKIRAEIEKISL